MKAAVIYINGLGAGNTRLQERLGAWWWRRKGVYFEHYPINWYKETRFEPVVNGLVATASRLVEEYDKVLLLGFSAGGSIAVHAMLQCKSSNVYAISCHARLRVGNAAHLKRRAHINSSRPAPAFYQSVEHLDATLSQLTMEQKKHILILTQLTDLVVPVRLMRLSGVATHRSFAFGHSGGFIAHMFTDRNLILRYLHKQ